MIVSGQGWKWSRLRPTPDPVWGVWRVCPCRVPFVSPFLLSSNENVLACALPLTQFGVCVPFVSPFLQGYQILDGSKNIGEKNIVSICHAQKSPIILYPTALNWHLYSRGCLRFLFNRLGCIEHSALHCNVDYSTTYMQSWAFEQVFALRHATTC